MFSEPSWDTAKSIGKMIGTIFPDASLSKKKKNTKYANPHQDLAIKNETSSEQNSQTKKIKKNKKSKNKYKILNEEQKRLVSRDSQLELPNEPDVNDRCEKLIKNEQKITKSETFNAKKRKLCEGQISIKNNKKQKTCKNSMKIFKNTGNGEKTFTKLDNNDSELFETSTRVSKHFISEDDKNDVQIKNDSLKCKKLMKKLKSQDEGLNNIKCVSEDRQKNNVTYNESFKKFTKNEEKINNAKNVNNKFNIKRLQDILQINGKELSKMDSIPNNNSPENDGSIKRKQILKKAKKSSLSSTTKTNDFTSKDYNTTDSNDTTLDEKFPTTSLTLKERMLSQLESARFRFLNESLYTRSSSDALEMFKDDEDAFRVYHEGFSNQISKWPTNPVDLMIQYIKKKPADLVVADFGCGDAKIARSVRNKEVHSFDLVALNQHITVCNMTKVPLKNSTVDIAVFCLSLMGTDFVKSLTEANRVLKKSGTLLIAEVISRFEKVGQFVRKMDKLGFSLKKKDDTNKMFIWFEFKKVKNSPAAGKIPKLELAPCFYKKR